MCNFLICFLIWLRFSKFKKYLLFFSPCSCHRALARIIKPSTFLSYINSSSLLYLSTVIRLLSRGLTWKEANDSWYLSFNSLSRCCRICDKRFWENNRIGSNIKFYPIPNWSSAGSLRSLCFLKPNRQFIIDHLFYIPHSPVAPYSISNSQDLCYFP